MAEDIKLAQQVDWNKLRETFIRAHMRRVSLRWPGAAAARKVARAARLVNEKTGRLGWHSWCAGCKGLFPEKELQVDHVEPVVPLYRDYAEAAYSVAQLGQAMQRMLPSPEGYQTLCQPCHKHKTAYENVVRKEQRRLQVGKKA